MSSKRYRKIRIIVKKSFYANKNKKTINQYFVRQIQSNLDKIGLDFSDLDNNFYIGALDSIERNTSNEFLYNGLSKDNILLVESKSQIALNHIENGFPCHHGTLESFADDKYDVTYSEPHAEYRTSICLGWYFDMYGQIGKQSQGILSTIAKTQFNIYYGCVFAFTFCRGRVKKYVHEYNKKIFIKKLIMLVKSKGCNSIIIKEQHKYCGDGNGERGAPMDWFLCQVV
jgi:hypothetical protein